MCPAHRQTAYHHSSACHEDEFSYSEGKTDAGIHSKWQCNRRKSAFPASTSPGPAKGRRSGTGKRAAGIHEIHAALLRHNGPRVEKSHPRDRQAAPIQYPGNMASDDPFGLAQSGKREERYAAVELLLHPHYLKWLTPERIDLVEELVVTGAWWDFADAIAGTGVGAMLTTYPAETALILRRWAGDDDLWKRRTAILAQLRRKKATDPELLFGVIEPSIARNEFFLRKGIGWALREYSKVEPETVVDYTTRNAARLSPLSKREGLKVLMKKGVISAIPA